MSGIAAGRARQALTARRERGASERSGARRGERTGRRAAARAAAQATHARSAAPDGERAVRRGRPRPLAFARLPPVWLTCNSAPELSSIQAPLSDAFPPRQCVERFCWQAAPCATVPPLAPPPLPPPAASPTPRPTRPQQRRPPSTTSPPQARAACSASAAHACDACADMPRVVSQRCGGGASRRARSRRRWGRAACCACATCRASRCAQSWRRCSPVRRAACGAHSALCL